MQPPITQGVPSPPIVPRWEWRAFGDGVDSVASRFATLAPERVEESDELYVLSSFGDDAIKVRGGLMDVKHLERVDDDGLEQWRPVMKAPFPLTAAQVDEVLAALRVAVSTEGHSSYTLDAFLDELVSPSPDLLAVEVHKQRSHYILDGCMAELTEIRTERGVARTIAVESEDPSRVSAAVQALGLAARPNVSVPRGLKTLFGLGASSYAVIDVGTNSVKLHIGARRADGSWSKLVDRSEITRLGEGLEQTGRLNDAPLARTVDAIAGMVDEARQNGVEGIAAVGTAGLRIAPNSAELLEAVRRRSGVDVEVISGEEEGRLAYLAVETGLGLAEGRVAIFDTGGGSSQFTFGHSGLVDERFSVTVGAVRYTERHNLGGAVSDETLAAALRAIADDLERLDGRPVPDALVALGGAVTNLAAVKHELATYDPDVVQGTVLDVIEIDRQIELYRTRTLEERRRIVGLQPKRADVILAGACIVRTVLQKLGRESLLVSDRGLRHGLLLERFGR